mmetsp:Transcript_30319/g.34438  ORF Transcript_30319/g.34438 Transcript_30319/m.34438 type:complete len:120 (+) Transcript_30319:60-419(+)|eukprot:CAMPEP_0115014046 /NCGR_PEP_ID=MMETSP0216-20121206/25809_1 /TAXON_ID=223996 /ORGANISM="Protocruzia adherens, Strain Boccale" /LENGTH=119 /DNA_ID=CAMNT_0002383639 /DNA_START=47 /DNA_END=406 /DNA_ORIENTATION=+
MVQTKKISYEELQKHNAEGDNWLLINGKVYDVSKFDSHPGGIEIMEEYAGTDATQEFDDVVHSDEAKKQMNDFYVGDIDESTISQAKVLPRKQKDAGFPVTAILLVGVIISLLVYINFS